MSKYRILIIDDRLNNLKTAEDVISSTYRPFDKIWSIEKEIAHIKVNKCDDEYSIDKQSIINIANLSAKPFDLLLFDIAYYIEGGSNEIYEKLFSKYNENYSFDVLEEYVFNPKSLVAEGRKQLENDNILLKQFNKNFVGHKGGIYGYTFIEDRWKILFYDLKKCKDILRETFSNADPKRIEVEGTRKEIFNDSEFGKIRNEKDGERYYSFILAKYLEQLIKIEITKQEIENAKYTKIERTSKVIGSLVFLCVVIGACSEFIGSLIIESFTAEKFWVVLVCVCIIILGIIFGGRLVLHFIENILPKLFYDNNQDKE